ncbi:UDP-N-acetylmuramate--L-alanine ligase [Planctopirus ephydatiae]|uniref:UDP-N-acetylmuramate--L-alanine ligase n=1 Tax=Planctopirus ephydatiae TaxID=2528019 RepID=UPI0011A363AA|nr:Mur ligase family protein [Planctopirus ephydatiae]
MLINSSHITEKLLANPSGKRSSPVWIHLIGVCGSGLRSLAEYLLARGFCVTGTDEQLPTAGLSELLPRGLVYTRQKNLPRAAIHSPDAAPQESGVSFPELVRLTSNPENRLRQSIATIPDLIIHSAAIPPADAGLQAARQAGIPAIPYHIALAHLINASRGLCIAGTHGKSTTTAMVAWMLSSSLAPENTDSEARSNQPWRASFIMGGELIAPLPLSQPDTTKATWHRSGSYIEGDWLIAEACEYRQHFVAYKPELAAILSCEPDHFDCFASEAELVEAFSKFAARVQPGGRLVTAADSPLALQAAENARAQVETFGLSMGNAKCPHWQARQIQLLGAKSRFELFYCGKYRASVQLQIPGRHNILNALAALAVTEQTGCPLPHRIQALASFQGIRRRFEWKGLWRGIHLIDDYAHHPTAVIETLRTARQIFGSRRIALAFEPHQVSRLQALLPEFAQSLALADQVLIAPVFAAREGNSALQHTLIQDLAQRVRSAGIPTEVCGTLDHLRSSVEHKAGTIDVLITAGAGHIDRIHYELSRRIPRHSQTRRATGSLHLDETGWPGAVLSRTA